MRGVHRRTACGLIVALSVPPFVGTAATHAPAQAVTATDAQPTAAAEPPSGSAAENVLSRCRAAWFDRHLPHSLRYVIVISARTDRAIDERYSGIMGSTESEFHVDRFSAQEHERPARPTGFNVYLSVLGAGVLRLNHDDVPTSILGTPQLTPRSSFGLTRPGMTLEKDKPPSALPLIATVVAQSRRYDVRLIDTEVIDGRPAIHLELRPTRDPHTYRLRELWVDATTFQPVRAITDGNFTDGPSLGVEWSITFQTVAGVTYIASESALEPLRFSRTRRYENVTISFVDLQPSTDPPPPLSTIQLQQSDDDLREPE